MNDRAIATAPLNTSAGNSQQDPFSSASFLALFWKPRFMPPSRSLLHVPMLFWLTTTLAPRRAAILGVGDGVAHFALCQAMETFKLRGGGDCVGYGYWSDSKSEKPSASVPAPLSEHQNMLYEGVSRLVAAESPTDALEELSARPVDLLCVDLEALPKNAVISADSVASAVAANGVLVLLGTQTLEERPHDGRGFLRLLNTCPSATFEGTTRATVLVMGNSLPGALRVLFESAQDAKLSPGAEAVFRRIGEGVFATARVGDLANARAKARRALAEAENALRSEQGLLSKSRERSAAQDRKINELQVEIFELHQQREALESAHARALGDLGAERDCLQERVRDCETKMARLASQRDDAVAEAKMVLKRLGESDAAHLGEITELTRISEEWRAQVEQSRLKQSALSAEVESLRGLLQGALDKVKQQRKLRHKTSAGFRALIKSLRKDLRESQHAVERSQQEIRCLEQRVGEILGSTSWKITLPLREFKSRLLNRRRKAT